MQHDVDFVEGQPVFHQPVKRLEAGAGVAGEEIHHLTVAPGAVLRDQCIGTSKWQSVTSGSMLYFLHSSNTAR